MSQSDLTFGPREHLSSSSLACWSVETNCFSPTVLLRLTLTSSGHKQPEKPAGCSLRSSEGWHPDRITSVHKKCNLWSITSVFFLSLSYFPSAHKILTKSFFDGGISHDCRKTAARRERKREGQMWGGWDGNPRTHQAHSSCRMWSGEDFTLTHLSQHTLWIISGNRLHLEQLWDSSVITPCSSCSLRGLFRPHYELNWDQPPHQLPSSAWQRWADASGWLSNR